MEKREKHVREVLRTAYNRNPDMLLGEVAKRTGTTTSFVSRIRLQMIAERIYIRAPCRPTMRRNDHTPFVISHGPAKKDGPASADLLAARERKRRFDEIQERRDMAKIESAEYW